MMEKILNSNKKCFYFTKFLRNHQCPLQHLHFYQDVNEFYNMFNTMREGIYITNF